MAEDAALERVIERLRASRERQVRGVQDFVRIPSVSADPAHAADVAHAAQWLIARLEDAGMKRARLVPTAGHPVVMAEWMEAGEAAPTLLIYGHYDVQPAQREDGWSRDPFSGDVVEGRIVGRGSSDMKGQFLCYLHALEAWLQETGGLPINVKVLVEGEEEVGSTHFQELLDREYQDLDADLILISDNPMRDPETPTIGYSTRGLVYFELHVEGPSHDLHSGVFGGVLRNPLEVIVQMLASLKDPKTGEILPAGFNDGIREASEAELQRLSLEGEPPERILSSAGVDSLFCLDGDIQLCLGLRPTLEVHGIRGGYIGPGSKTVIPASAHAKFSARIVWDQDPDKVAEAVIRHLDAHAPEGVRTRVEVLHTVYPVYEDPDDPVLEPVQRALEATWGQKAVRVPIGGSIGAMACMARTLRARPYLVAFGNSDEGMHGPDEFFRTGSLYRGGEAMARLFWEMGRLRHGHVGQDAAALRGANAAAPPSRGANEAVPPSRAAK